MNVVFIIPTGIGCAIGGHAGDATPAAKLIASTCDKLILHPNVVNASDINEMPSNSLYVEGSILDRWLQGYHDLKEVRSNRVLVVVNPPAQPDTINAVNAAKTTIGMDATIIHLDRPLAMTGYVEDGIATGQSVGVDELIDQVKDLEFDALAIATEIIVSEDESLRYFREGGVNPWGGIEAIVSREVARAIKKPVAHAPIESDETKNSEELFYLPFNKVVNPRMAAEVISNCYLHCVLKGLHDAPRVVESGLSSESVGAMITPYGCIGAPHLACFKAGIPVIAVRENTTCYNEEHPSIIYVDNYLEAAGLLMCMNAGVSSISVRA